MNKLSAENNPPSTGFASLLSQLGRRAGPFPFFSDEVLPHLVLTVSKRTPHDTHCAPTAAVVDARTLTQKAITQPPR